MKTCFLFCVLYATLAYDSFAVDEKSSAVLKHYRFEGGVPLASEQKTEEAADPDAIRAMEHLQAKLIQDVSAPKEFKPLPVCQRDRSESRPIAKELGQELTRYRSDILFIPAKAPRDPDELFGTKTSLISCTAGQEKTCSRLARELEIFCLPTRVRFSATSIRHDEGLKALYNYELDREGELHPLVKDELRHYRGK